MNELENQNLQIDVVSLSSFNGEATIKDKSDEDSLTQISEPSRENGTYELEKKAFIDKYIEDKKKKTKEIKLKFKKLMKEKSGDVNEIENLKNL